MFREAAEQNQRGRIISAGYRNVPVQTDAGGLHTIAMDYAPRPSSVRVLILSAVTN